MAKKKAKKSGDDCNSLINMGRQGVSRYLGKEEDLREDLYLGISHLYNAYCIMGENGVKKRCRKKNIRIREGCLENGFIRSVWKDIDNQNQINRSKLFTYGRVLRNMKENGILPEDALELLREKGIDTIANPRISKQDNDTELDIEQDKIDEEDDIDFEENDEDFDDESEDSAPSKKTLRRNARLRRKKSTANNTDKVVFGSFVNNDSDEEVEKETLDDSDEELSNTDVFLEFIEEQGYQDSKSVFFRTKGEVFYSTDDAFVKVLQKAVDLSVDVLTSLNEIEEEEE